MTPKPLERLRTDEFAAVCMFLSTASAIRRQLLRTEEVRRIRGALNQGALRESDLRGFVSTLMRDLRAGERFEHEMAVAAIAVALERRPTAFAEEYLRDLARVKLAEMCLCSRVAQECLKHRDSVAGTRRRDWSLLPTPSGAEPAADGEAAVSVAADVDTETKAYPIGEAA